MNRIPKNNVVIIILFFIFSCISSGIAIILVTSSKFELYNVNAATSGDCSNVDLKQTTLNQLNAQVASKQNKLEPNLGKYYGISSSTLISSSITSYDNSVPSYVNVRSMTLEAGKYFIFYYIAFPTNSMGWRTMGLKINDASGNASTGTSGAQRVGANANGYTNLSGGWVVNLTEQGTIYLVAQQASGTSMTLIASGMTAIRIW